MDFSSILCTDSINICLSCSGRITFNSSCPPPKKNSPAIWLVSSERSTTHLPCVPLNLLQGADEHFWSLSKLRSKRHSVPSEQQGESGMPPVTDEYILDLAKKDLINILGLKVKACLVYYPFHGHAKESCIFVLVVFLLAYEGMILSFGWQLSSKKAKM